MMMFSILPNISSIIYTRNSTLYNTSNFCVSVHMNPVATHEFSGDFARDLKEYLDSIDNIDNR